MSQSQSRQQRRAEERAAGKRRRHTPRPERTFEVELYMFTPDEVDEDPDGRLVWGAECGLQDESVGYDVTDDDESLQGCVDGALAAARRWTDRYRIRMQWTLTTTGGDLPTLAAEAGVELPEWA